MGFIQRLRKAVAAFMDESMEAATEGKATEGRSKGVPRQETAVPDTETGYAQLAMDTKPQSQAPEWQEEPVLVETSSSEESEYSDASPYPLTADEGVSLPQGEPIGPYYYWSDRANLLEMGLPPSRYGYQLTNDKRAAQRHNDRGEVYLVSVIGHHKEEEIDLCGASDELIREHVSSAKRKGKDRLIVRNASDGERIYDRIFVFKAEDIKLMGKTDYRQDLEQVLPTLSGIVASEVLDGSDNRRGVEFVLFLDGEEKLATVTIDEEGHIEKASLVDDSYEPLEMFLGLRCDEVFGEGALRFFRENPYSVYERGSQEELLRQKTRIINQLMDRGWEARLPESLHLPYPDKTHICNWVEYHAEADVLALGEVGAGQDSTERYPLYAESLSLKDFENLLLAHDFYLRLENLVEVAGQSVPEECVDELATYIKECEHERRPETVKGIEYILENHEQLGNSPEVMRRISVLRRETGLPTVEWNRFPQLDGDELDWLVRSYAYQLYEVGPNKSLPMSLAKHFPQLQKIAEEGTREAYLDYLGHIQTMACCKWEQQQESISYDETESVWQGGNAGGKWLECLNESATYKEHPDMHLNPDLNDFRGVEHKADGLWYGYRYEQPQPKLLIEKDAFIAYAFAKGSMSVEEAHDWAAQIKACRSGLHFTNGVSVSLQVDPLYIALTFTKEGKRIGSAEIGASEIASCIPLERHLEEMSEMLLQVFAGDSIPKDVPMHGLQSMVEWNRIFPDNYKVILENDYQWKMLANYQEAKGIALESKPDHYPAERRINGDVPTDEQLKDKVIDIGDFLMGSYLEITPKAELDTLLSRFDGVFCTDLFEVYLDRPQRIFDETGIRYYQILIGKEGEYRLTSHRHDGNIPVPGYMNRQLLIDTLRTQEKQMGLRNKDVDEVLRWGVDVGDDHFMVKRMDDGLFYLSRDGYHGEGRGVELSAAFDCFEQAMQRSQTEGVRFHAEEDCGTVYEKIRQHVSRYYLLQPIPVSEQAQASGLCFEGTTPMAILTGRSRADFSEEMTFPAALLPVRARVFYEQQLTKEFSVSEKSHGLQVMDTPVYRGDREPEYSSMLLAELRGKGLLDTRFNRPFSIRSDGHEYKFKGCFQGKVDNLPTILFRMERDGYALSMPVSLLPHEITIPVVNETYRQLKELQTAVESPKHLIVHRDKQDAPSRSGIVYPPEEIQYLADTMEAYGIESVSFEEPLRVGGIKVYRLEESHESLAVEVMDKKVGEHTVLALDDLPNDVISEITGKSLDAIYGGQTESFRDALAEKDLMDILQTDGRTQVQVNLQGYGPCEVALQKNHVVLSLPASDERKARSIPWLAIDSMQTKADIEQQLRSLPFIVEGDRVLYQDSLSTLRVHQGTILLEGQILSFDVTEACRQLGEAGVNLNQASRESLSAFCHRHKTVFETSQGSIKAQLFREGDEYQLRIESSPQKNPYQEQESVL